MKVYKFIVNVDPIKDNYEDFENDLNIALSFKINKYIAESKLDNGNYVIYLYVQEEKLYQAVVDVFLDYNIIIKGSDITEKVKLDYTQFKDIDDVFNYDLLRDFLKSEFSEDFILDYISNNNIDKFNNCIVEKFFPTWGNL